MLPWHSSKAFKVKYSLLKKNGVIPPNFGHKAGDRLGKFEKKQVILGQGIKNMGPTYDWKFITSSEIVQAYFMENILRLPRFPMFYHIFRWFLQRNNVYLTSASLCFLGPPLLYIDFARPDWLISTIRFYWQNRLLNDLFESNIALLADIVCSLLKTVALSKLKWKQLKTSFISLPHCKASEVLCRAVYFVNYFRRNSLFALVEKNK